MFFLAVSVAGFKAYGEHMSASYFSIKQKMLALFETANGREMPEIGDSAARSSQGSLFPLMSSCLCQAMAVQ